MRRAPSAADQRAVWQALGARRSKYGATRVVVDGIRFDSQAEAARYSELKLLERAGEIRGLVCHPWFVLFAPTMVNAVENVNAGRVTGRQAIGRYVADFLYLDSSGAIVIEDVKGVRTALYRWKKKHVEAQYGVRIVEIGGTVKRNYRALKRPAVPKPVAGEAR